MVCCCGVEERVGRKEAQAERLRNGYRYSFLLSHALIYFNSCDRSACTQPTVLHTRRCVRNKCLLQLTGGSHLCDGLIMVPKMLRSGYGPVNCQICKRATHPSLQEMGFGPGRASS